jgi:hypothetical protein
MKYCFLGLLLGLLTVPAIAQTVTVGYQQTVQLNVPGATAAYSLNSYYADASVNVGTLTIQGNHPGSTTVMVITGVGIQPYHVSVPQPAPVFPPGFPRPGGEGASAEEGSYELRFSNDPYQLQNAFDFTERQGDRTIRLHAENVDYLPPAEGQSPAAFPSLSYEIETPGRDVTFLDQMVSDSPLTLDNVLVRGFHFRDQGWLFHGGYTAQTSFQNLFLPAQKEAVGGIGYQFSLGNNSFLTPSLYYFQGSNASQLSAGHPGTLGSLEFRHEIGKHLAFLAEAGLGGGPGFAGRLKYHRQADEQIYANLRYEAPDFHSVAVNNLHGFLSDLHWERKLGRRTSSSLSFSGNQYDLPTLPAQVNISSDWTVDYQFSRHWFGNGGYSFSRFSGGAATTGPLQNLQFPLGVSFTSAHFGAGFQYREALNNSQGGNGRGFRTNVSGSTRQWELSAYVDRQTQTPTVTTLYSSIPGLQDTLDRLGIAATSPEQVSDLLRNDAVLLALGYINQLSWNLSPVLLQAGTTLNWKPGGSSLQQLYLGALYTSNQTISNTVESTIYTATYSRQLTRANTVFASASLFRSTAPGTASGYRPLLEISLRHKFNRVPWLLIPGRSGTIAGTAFQDTAAQGVFRDGMPRLAAMEIVLDGTRHTTTDAQGHYYFAHVPFGAHQVEAVFHSGQPYFFTTPTPVATEINASVDFGVVFTRARLIGHVVNDAGVGLSGVTVSVTGAQKTYTAVTDGEGHFLLADLAAGSYRIEPKAESLPAGYLSEGLDPVTTDLQLGAPTHVTFTSKAIRTISGRVKAFDSQGRKEVLLGGIKVTIVELKRESITDEEGNYLFRELPAGSFTLLVNDGKQDFTLKVTLAATPAFSRDNDFDLGAR